MPSSISASLCLLAITSWVRSSDDWCSLVNTLHGNVQNLLQHAFITKIMKIVSNIRKEYMPKKVSYFEYDFLHSKGDYP